MENKHYYKNHEHVISVLTTRYGFTHTGTGDNYEECFYKDSETPEQIYVHQMHCSYDMYSSQARTGPRLHPVNFQSDHNNEKEQEKAFTKLLAHLDKVTVRKAAVVTPAIKADDGIPQTTTPSFQEIMEFNRDVWPLFRTYFGEGKFSAKEALDFLDRTKPKTKKVALVSTDVVEEGYVIFVEIPQRLTEIIHEGHPYFVYEIKDGKAHLFLDNDCGNWIDINCLCGVSRDSVQRRRKY